MQGKQPSAHDITFTTKHLGQTADHDIGMRQDVHVQKIANGFVDDHDKVVLVGKMADPAQIGGLQEGIAWKFAKQSGRPQPSLQPLFQIVKILARHVAVEPAAGAEFLQYLQRIDVGKAGSSF